MRAAPIVRDFTVRAVARFHGDISSRGTAWRIGHVPARLRDGLGSAVKHRYDSVSFERAEGPIPSVVPPELISPGHPLLAALVGAVTQECGAALTRGIVLGDDRESDDYVLLTLLTEGPAERAASVETLAMRAEDGPWPVSPALYTSLQAEASPACEAEVAAAQHAVATAQRETPDAHVAVVAYVRGTADPDTAEAWRTARRRLEEELAAASASAVPALPGQGWDFMTADRESTFWLATPTVRLASRRRSETQAAANVGPARFAIRTFDT
ncbi:hypothetical protein Sya03_24990 [Spirilliplanes yamanashiensis]|uniref:Uncharacterized protein n=1 Tax=Spirilliplanes yamanashiensis TaxID=42233 RepID=A0A8J4DIJ5_9ACTN|nr:hypothetical protein Sya03_24990 [Spirilliplanes yamanashiensis]